MLLIASPFAERYSDSDPFKVSNPPSGFWLRLALAKRSHFSIMECCQQRNPLLLQVTLPTARCIAFLPVHLHSPLAEKDSKAFWRGVLYTSGLFELRLFSQIQNVSMLWVSSRLLARIILRAIDYCPFNNVDIWWCFGLTFDVNDFFSKFVARLTSLHDDSS